MNTTLPSDVKAAWERGDKVEAIRLLRQHTGLGLKEAKEALESGSYSKELGPVSVQVARKTIQVSPEVSAKVFAAITLGDKIAAITLLRESTGMGLKEAKDVVDAMEKKSGGGAAPGTAGLAPGEMPRSKFNPVWIAVLIIAAVVGWLVLGST